MTFIAALRCDQIDAPFVFDQPINAASFTAWVTEQLCPTIRARGARLLFLSLYSPDLNPIEQVFVKLKHLMRKAAERTHEATWRRTGTLLESFQPDECANYLRNSGYASM